MRPLLLLSLLLPAPQLAVDKWIEVSAEVVNGENETLEQGFRRAVDTARRDALEQGVGVEVSGQTLTYNNQVVEDLVKTLARGYVIDEKLLSKKRVMKGDSLVHQVKMRVHVVAPKAERDPNFNLTAKLDRSTYKVGDLVRVDITSTRDAYLNVFSVADDGSVGALLPNRLGTPNKLTANQPFVFPPANQKNLKLEVGLPQGVNKQTERLKLIATRQPVDLLQGQFKENIGTFYSAKDTGLLETLLRQMVQIDAREIAETTLLYTIER